MNSVTCKGCSTRFYSLDVNSKEDLFCEDCFTFLHKFDRLHRTIPSKFLKSEKKGRRNVKPLSSRKSKSEEGDTDVKGTPFRKSSKSDNFELLLEYQINRLMR